MDARREHPGLRIGPFHRLSRASTQTAREAVEALTAIGYEGLVEVRMTRRKGMIGVPVWQIGEMRLARGSMKAIASDL